MLSRVLARDTASVIVAGRVNVSPEARLLPSSTAPSNKPSFSTTVCQTVTAHDEDLVSFKMLPPFKIRNLRRSTSGAPLKANLGVTDYDPVVKLSAPAYDTTVARYPEAMLKYFDEDDCDIITACSDVLI